MISAFKRRFVAVVVGGACLALTGLMVAREMGGQGGGRVGPGGAGGTRRGPQGEERSAGDLVKPDW